MIVATFFSILLQRLRGYIYTSHFQEQVRREDGVASQQVSCMVSLREVFLSPKIALVWICVQIGF